MVYFQEALLRHDILYDMSRIAKRKKKRIWYHHPLLLFSLFLILIVFVRGTYTSFVKKNNSQNEYEKYHQELLELQQKKVDLEQNIEHLKTERGREEEYRERFNVVKERERVIRIIEDDENS